MGQGWDSNLGSGDGALTIGALLKAGGHNSDPMQWVLGGGGHTPPPPFPLPQGPLQSHNFSIQIQIHPLQLAARCGLNFPHPHLGPDPRPPGAPGPQRETHLTGRPPGSRGAGVPLMGQCGSASGCLPVTQEGQPRPAVHPGGIRKGLPERIQLNLNFR